MKPPLEQNYYELLEVPRDATIAELDRAYDRAKAYYGPGSIATYSLTSPDELKLVQDRIDEAYLVLAEEKARAEYLARIGPPTPDERPLHREVREAQAERDAARDAALADAEERSAASEADHAVAPSAPAGDHPPTSEPAPAAVPAPEPIPSTNADGGAPSEPVATRDSRAELPASGDPRPGRSAEPAEAAATQPSAPQPALRDPEPTPEVSAPDEKTNRPAAAPGPVPPPLMEYPEPSPKAAAKARAEPTRPSARAVEIPPDAVFSGELLRQVRESQALSLQELSDRTKIGKVHLDNIEADRYDALPAQVYLRGFLMSYARVLKLDPLRVSKSYLDAVGKAKAGKAK